MAGEGGGGVRGFKLVNCQFACQVESSYGPAFWRTLNPLQEFLDLPPFLI